MPALLAKSYEVEGFCLELCSNQSTPAQQEYGREETLEHLEDSCGNLDPQNVQNDAVSLRTLQSS